ncbi:hypothetical protein [Arcicella rigui]|uniref:Uncharacterized protein n=1 Tax=Arcicella rigui TaxID=797020 RepID=A0ABU5QBT3_9BACT|nr:hypothetical protein [Arcicella rigui]MEA5140313.1 hypothetical protein [Arcicella rigui]
MTIVLKKGQKLEEVLPPNISAKGSKKLNAKKYVGMVKSAEDPLEIQRRIRNEWE